MSPAKTFCICLRMSKPILIQYDLYRIYTKTLNSSTVKLYLQSVDIYSITKFANEPKLPQYPIKTS